MFGLLLLQEATQYHAITKGINTNLKQVKLLYLTSERQGQTSTSLMAESFLLIQYINIFLAQLILCALV